MLGTQMRATQQMAAVTPYLLIIRNSKDHPLWIPVVCATWGQAHLWGPEPSETQMFSIWFSEAPEPSGNPSPNLYPRSPQGWASLEERCL